MQKPSLNIPYWYLLGKSDHPCFNFVVISSLVVVIIYLVDIIYTLPHFEQIY